MKHYEKDTLVLGLVSNFLKRTNRKIADYIPNFEQDQFIQFTDNLPSMKNGEATVDALKYIATECYNRIKKKFPKE